MLAKADSLENLQACASIAEDQARLICYDRAAARLASGRATSAETIAASGRTTAMTSPPLDTMPERSSRRPLGSAPSPDQTGDSAAPRSSLLTRAWSFNPDSEPYLIKLYRPNYLNPVRWQSRTNDHPFTPLFTATEAYDGALDKVEAAFQISFKTRFWASEDRRWGAWFAYTQQSFWQLYNENLSSPFRDTDYEPEVKLVWQPQRRFAGFDWQLLGIGYNHESNGRADPISRSWDRLVAEIGIERGNFALLLRPWLRVDDDSDDADNPDILDYYGHGDLTAIYKWRGHSFTLMGRGNLAEKKGALRVSWMSPPLLGPLRAYLVGFSGHGDTLMDYNFKQNAVSAGIALNDFLDR